MADSRLTIEPKPDAVPLSRAPRKGESYWDLVFRQFRRNRLAVVSLAFVVGLFYIAIAAPFLSNNRPIVLRGSFRTLYKDRFEERSEERRVGKECRL